MKSATDSPLAIRRADARDAAPLVARLGSVATLEYTAADIAPVTPESDVAYWEKRLAELADASHLPLVAIRDDAIVGVLLLRGFANYLRRKHSAALDFLVVRPDARGQGIGRALMNAALATVDQCLHVRRIELAVPHLAPGSERLQRWCATFGFAHEGVRRRDGLHAGRYTDSSVMVRINAAVLPAPPAPALLLPSSRKRARNAAPLKLSIRPATEDDAAAFSRVFSDRSTASGTLQHPYTSAEIWRTRLSGNTNTRHVSLVAVVNGRVVGSAGVHPVSDHPRHRHACSLGLGIAEAYQGRGVGRALMQACLDFADRWANYSRVELTVHADNARAITLYESLGFVTEGRHREYSFREGGYVDALFMARLSPALASLEAPEHAD